MLIEFFTLFQIFEGATTKPRNEGVAGQCSISHGKVHDHVLLAVCISPSIVTGAVGQDKRTAWDLDSVHSTCVAMRLHEQETMTLCS